jgi:hypothetical protein
MRTDHGDPRGEDIYGMSVTSMTTRTFNSFWFRAKHGGRTLLFALATLQTTTSGFDPKPSRSTWLHLASTIANHKTIIMNLWYIALHLPRHYLFHRRTVQFLSPRRGAMRVTLPQGRTWTLNLGGGVADIVGVDDSSNYRR